MKSDLEPMPPPAQEPHRDADVSGQPFQVGDVLPARMFAEDMQRAFRIGRARFYELMQAGKFDRFELKVIGRRSWSGKLVQAFLDGEQNATRFSVVRKQA